MISANIERIGSYCNRKMVKRRNETRREFEAKKKKREALINTLIMDRAKTAKVKIIY